MRNCSYKMDKGKLVITVDVSQTACADAPSSTSGKTNMVASSGGFVAIPSPDGFNVSFSLNVTAKANG